MHEMHIIKDVFADVKKLAKEEGVSCSQYLEYFFAILNLLKEGWLLVFVSDRDAQTIINAFTRE